MPVLCEPRTVDLKTTRVYGDILEAFTSGQRRILLEGGTSSSKTYSALQAIYSIALLTTNPLIISVVSESLPHLRKGAIRDWFNIIGEKQDDNQNWSKTDFTYTFPANAVQVEFFGADDAGKVRGPRRNILFLNEANRLSWETARGLDVRTDTFTLADWNPTGEFWAHEFWKGQPGNSFSHSTYLDAVDVLPPSVIANIESNRDKDPNWWNIYGLGLPGKVDGLVYPLPEIVKELPTGYPSVYGLDFGYLVDPTALSQNVIIGDKLYSHELIYEDGLDNQQIIRRMDLLHIPKAALIVADADEPKSIRELVAAGYHVVECPKGPGSVAYMHQKVNQFFQYWTEESVNGIKEQRNFRYITRKDPGGHEYLSNDTTHQYSHLMSARRFAVSMYRPMSTPPRPVSNH